MSEIPVEWKKKKKPYKVENMANDAFE